MTDPLPRRRWWWPNSLAGRFVALGGWSLFLLIVLWFVALFITERRLAEAMKRAEVEFGLSNRMEDLLPGNVPDELNAAIPLGEAVRVVQALLSQSRTAQKETAHQLTQQPSFAATLSQSNLNALLDEAERRPQYASTISRSQHLATRVGDPLIARRDVFTVERATARRLAATGSADGAVHRFLRMLRISRKSLGNEPFLSTAVSDALQGCTVMFDLNEILRERPLSDTTHSAIDLEMNEQAACSSILPKLYQMEKIKRLNDFDSNPSRVGAWWMFGPIANNDRRLIVEWHDLLARTSHLPRMEAEKETGAANAELWRISKHPLDRLLHPDALGGTSHEQRGAFDYLTIQARCLRIANAMAVQKAWDADPSSLGLRTESLVDPITGNTQLRVKRTSGGPIVYSVGFDFEDNGGVLEGPNIKGMDVGLGPARK